MTDQVAFRRFVLQALDPMTGTPAVEAQLHITDVSRLRGILGEAANSDPNLDYAYEIERHDLKALGELSHPPFIPEDCFTHIEPWHSIREVPYLVHTGYELPLMLEGRKPLAVFHDVYPTAWFDELIERYRPFVLSGHILQQIVERPFKEDELPYKRGFRGDREAYFALPKHEWRIAAYRLLRDVASKSGWNEALERFEGSLLGYEDWQNDWWINRKRLNAEPHR
jgi:hypothetical protein